MEPSAFSSPDSPFSTVVGFIVSVLIFICFCFCPCCYLYKLCCKPRPTNTTVVTTTSSASPYQGVQYTSYQPVSIQSGYVGQPVPQGYGLQPMPTVPYPGQPFTPGPPPTYQEAIGPAYPPNLMPYSQATFNPGQPSYPPQPPVQPPVQPLQPNAPSTQPNFLAQPAYNPDFVAPPPSTG